MLRVLAIGYEPAAFLPDEPVPVGFPSALGRDDLDAVVEVVADTVIDGGTTVALYPSWSPEPTRRRLETVRAALDTTRLLPWPSSLPPLAGGVAASLAAALPPHLASDGELVGALATLEEQLLSIAWLSRVTGLTEPAPTIAQHLVSLLPRTRFGLSSFPQPTVRRLSTAAPGIRLPTVGSSAEMRVAVASRQGDIDWLRSVVTPALDEPPLVEVAPTTLGPAYWGPGRLLEAVVYPTDLAVTARAVSAGLEQRLCAWCGELTTGTRCPFCGYDAGDRGDSDLAGSTRGDAAG